MLNIYLTINKIFLNNAIKFLSNIAQNFDIYYSEVMCMHVLPNPWTDRLLVYFTGRSLMPRWLERYEARKILSSLALHLALTPGDENFYATKQNSHPYTPVDATRITLSKIHFNFSTVLCSQCPHTINTH